jgi:hypothetical protein
LRISIGYSRETLTMRILFEDGVCEEVEVTHLSAESVRLEETPMASSDEGRFGDVIEVARYEGDVFRFVRLIRRSDLEMATFLVSQKVADDEAFIGVLSRATATGVHWERAFGGVLILHGSPGQIAAAEALLREALDSA